MKDQPLEELGGLECCETKIRKGIPIHFHLLTNCHLEETQIIVIHNNN